MPKCSTFIFLRRVLTFPPNPRNVRRCSRTGSFVCSLLLSEDFLKHQKVCVAHDVYLTDIHDVYLSDTVSLNPEAMF